MERLTQTSNKGGVAFTFNLDITCAPSEAQKILKLAEKLKSYEDLGYTPEKCRAALDKQEPFEPETVGLTIGIGRCKCGVEFLSKTNYCGNCGQKLKWNAGRVTEQEDMEARR